MKRAVHVRNLITDKIDTFYNDLSLEANLITAIIIQEYELSLIHI